MMIGTYAGSYLYPTIEKNEKREQELEALRTSGISTVILWSIHIAKEINDNDPPLFGNTGDLFFNPMPKQHPPIPNLIASGGQYKGDSGWNGLLDKLKTGGTVNRILLSIGCCGQFNEIAKLPPGSMSPGGILYQNFLALRQNLPAIDGIDFDYEEGTYDNQLVVNFANMLNQIGFNEITFCPYQPLSKDNWINSIIDINTPTHPNLVNSLNLQCYSGGMNNDPTDWIMEIRNKVSNPPLLYPGLGALNCCSRGYRSPDQMTQALKDWNSEATGKSIPQLEGAWLWVYDTILVNEKETGYSFQDYVNALITGLQ